MSWAELEEELGQWRSAGEVATLWWRDDDTNAWAPSLDKLLQIGARYAAPIHLAVVPGDIKPDLAPTLAGYDGVSVMQHGFAHINHAAKGTGASEVGIARDMSDVRSDLAEGWARLNAACLPNVLPGFCPPWNRMGEDKLPLLNDLGFRFYSGGGARSDLFLRPGLAHVNIHFDPIRWKEGAQFRGTDRTLSSLIHHLRLRRTGGCDATEPTGLNTHHLQTDDAAWSFIEELADRLARHKSAAWVRIGPEGTPVD